MNWGSKEKKLLCGLAFVAVLFFIAYNLNFFSNDFVRNIVDKSFFASASPKKSLPDDSPCGYFVRSIWNGRLGNQMFAYASFYGMVKKQENFANKTAFIRVGKSPSSLHQIFENLSIAQEVVSDAWFKSKNFTALNENRCCAYDKTGFDQLKCDGKNVMVFGYRCSFRYFDHVFEEIRKEFSFPKSIREKSERLINDSLATKRLSRNDCAIVGVHLRRGDYLSRGSARSGAMPARFDYLQKAIRYHENLHFRNNTKSIDCLVFLIFGNTYEWNMDVSKKVQLLRPNSSHLVLIDYEKSTAEIDMCALSLCDHTIITTGSYSLWAGFFSRGVVTYQKQYAKPNTNLYSQIEPNDWFLPHWIAL